VLCVLELLRLPPPVAVSGLSARECLSCLVIAVVRSAADHRWHGADHRT
jgi:hypothetical protein